MAHSRRSSVGREGEAKALMSVIISNALYSFSLTYSHSILLNLNVNRRFLGHFNKRGPCARTCIGLQRGFLTESELQGDATRAARKLARDPAAIINLLWRRHHKTLPTLPTCYSLSVRTTGGRLIL
jgi:hypothetical protein